MKEIQNFLNTKDFEKFYKAIPEIQFIDSSRGGSSKAYTKNIRPKDLQVMFRLMYSCALRTTEVLDLKTSDFDLDNSYLTIRGQKGKQTQKTTILPTDIPMLKDFLSKTDAKLFNMGRGSPWAYCKAIGEKANLKMFKKTKVQQIEGIFPKLFRESRKKQMVIDKAPQSLIDLKLRIPSKTVDDRPTLAELKEWEEENQYVPSYGIVIILDALGTKGIWKSRNPGYFLKTWDYILKRSNAFVESEGKFKTKFTVKSFSDTIIISGEEDDIIILLLESGRLLKALIAVGLHMDFYLRGCFSVGKFYSSENILIGPAVDEAAIYFEQGNWIGVFAAPSAFGVLERLSNDKKFETALTKNFIKYNIPLKNKVFHNGWALKIDPSLRAPNTKKINQDYVGKTIKEIVYYQLENLNDVESGEKWKNTLEYLNFIETSN